MTYTLKLTSGELWWWTEICSDLHDMVKEITGLYTKDKAGRF